MTPAALAVLFALLIIATNERHTTMPTVALPPKVRATIYLVYGIIGLLLGSTQVAHAAGGWAQPTWLTVSLAVFAFLGTGLGLTAASNTPVEGRRVAP